MLTGRSLTAWALPALAALGCQTTGVDPLLPPPGEEVLVVFDQDLSRWPRAPWGLRDARIEGDTLVVVIDHAGGCREHRYWLLAAEGFTVLPTLGPLPVASVPLLLAHDDGGDACEALLTRTLRWSLDPLREAYRREFGPGVFILQLRLPEGQGASGERLLTWGPTRTDG